MKKAVILIVPVLLVLIGLSPDTYASSASFINRIDGTVYDSSRTPLENARVELLTETSSTYGSVRTSSSGRFSFTGMPPGRYTVHVLPFGTNLLEQSQEVVISNITRLASDSEYIDIYLQIDKRIVGTSPDTAPEAIFVQVVPPEAKKLYADGADDLRTGRTTGIAKLESALAVFPTYFDALSLLGKHYVLQRAYDKGYPYLIRAIDVNPRSYASYFRLGWAFYQLKHYPAALEASKAAAILSPGSLDALSLYGTMLRIRGDFPNAEKILQKANTIAAGKNADVHMQLALLFNRLNRNKDAIAELRTYLELSPKAADKAQIEGLIAKLQAGEKIPN